MNSSKQSSKDIRYTEYGSEKGGGARLGLLKFQDMGKNCESGVMER
jgi:hypothetical protein